MQETPSPQKAPWFPLADSTLQPQTQAVTDMPSVLIALFILEFHICYLLHLRFALVMGISSFSLFIAGYSSAAQGWATASVPLEVNIWLSDILLCHLSDKCRAGLCSEMGLWEICCAA